MTATKSEAALLATICAKPGEDTPRLALADWLEENGREAFAKFIRVQLQLAKLKPLGSNHGACRTAGRDRPCTACREREELQALEDELAVEIDSAFGELPLLWTTDQIPLAQGIIVRRGLPSSVRCTLAEWMGRKCEACAGHGWRANHASDYPLIDSVKCSVCQGAKIIPAIGPALAQRWPIVEVQVTDRRSYLRPEPRDDEWLWYVEDANTEEELRPYSVPVAIYELMIESHPQGDDGWLYLRYDSELDARRAASGAMIKWTRQQPIELAGKDVTLCR